MGTHLPFNATGLVFILFFSPEANFSQESIAEEIEELGKGFNSAFSISQVVRVHALILIIKISFPPLATMCVCGGVRRWSITYKWKSYLICGKHFFTPLIAFPD